MRMSERDRRDWGLLVFIVPLGILLMLIAGQFAMRIIPQWVLDVGMGSRLEVEIAGGQQSFIQPFFNAQILTPFSWQNTYLTPNADGGLVFPPFVVLEPSATPSTTPTVVTPDATEVTPTPIATTATPSLTATIVATTPPPTSTEVTPPPATCTDPAATNNGGPLPCVYPPTTCTDPAATNNGGPLPCVYPPTTCTDPAATNNGGPLPCEYPPTTCTDPIATNNGGPLPCVYGITSTPDPTYTLDPSPPPDLGVNVPPDGNVSGISDGHYVILNITVLVGITPDNNYDLVFYEFQNGGSVFLDSIIIGISKSADGNNDYYEVFNWGNGTSDINSNVDVNNLPSDPNCPSNTECDNREIPASNLYPTPGAGILIDVDSASSSPPPGSYDSVWIISPVGGSGQSAEVDAVQAVEVPIPPTP